MDEAENIASNPPKSRLWLDWLQVTLAVYFLICAVSLIGGGFKLFAGDEAKELFAFATHPVAGLVVGTVATALIQSSSTVVSIIVGFVAGGLPVSVAIPMIMGADIGTSITNTLVSLGHVRKKEEFRRAFAAATVQDFFNLISVIIFLPLEMATGFLECAGDMVATSVRSLGDASMKEVNIVKLATKPLVKFTQQNLVDVAGESVGGVLAIVLGIAVIFAAIHVISRDLQHLMVGRAKKMLFAAVGRGPLSGILSGTIVTVLVQSSSTTTSLMVPLAGSGTLSIRQIYPFTLGANIGTCITAMLAATAVTGDAHAALQIASFHFLYNLVGVIVIFGLPILRFSPVYCAEWLGDLAVKNRLYALAYILTVFFIIPGAVLLICR